MMQFTVHPDVIIKLGNELVADEFTALLEVAKNAYDAGATRVIIEVETRNGPAGRGSYFPDAPNYISIRDNGIGMDEEDIRDGWLVVAHSRKRQPKQLSLPFAGTGRVPLGDKGIGRLGLQRVGDGVDVLTTTGGDRRVHIGYRWSDFAKHSRLDNINVRFGTAPTTGASGTEIVVSDLRDPSIWRGASGRDRLKAKLSQLLSPFAHLTRLSIVVTQDGEPVDLAEVGKSVLETANCRCEFEWRQATGLKVRLFYRASFLVSGDEDEEEDNDIEEELTTREQAMRQMRKDGGLAFHAFLEATSPGSYKHSSDPPMSDWSLSREVNFQLVDLDLEPEDPGPFEGAIYNLPRARRAGDLPNTFSRVQEFREFLKAQAGVRVFRNGFTVRPYGIDGDDWLRFGAERESGRSWYYLKPGGFVGYVSISAEHNSQLEEKTDREGFVETAASRNFIKLTRRVAKFVNQENTFLRRQQLAYGKSIKDAADDTPTPEEGEGTQPANRPQQTKKRVQGARRRAAKLREPTVSAADLADAATTIDSITKLAASLQAEVDVLRAEIAQLSELASLGLTVEALSHELANITDGLHQRTQAIAKRARAVPDVDRQFLAYFEYSRSAVVALRKQLSHVAPSLQYARERRAPFDVCSFLAGVREYHEERLRLKGVDLQIEVGTTFMVIMSVGRLAQVLDNLVLNSEYWSMRAGAGAQIRVRHVDGIITVEDSGPGVADHMRDRLFQPFQSAKDDGRGLGLFICRQLLDADRCSIKLLPDLNAFGRPYIFEVDLRNAQEGQDNGG